LKKSRFPGFNLKALPTKDCRGFKGFFKDAYKSIDYKIMKTSCICSIPCYIIARDDLKSAKPPLFLNKVVPFFSRLNKTK